MFSCKICEIFKNTYFKEHLRLTISKPLLHEVWGIPRSLEHLDRASFYFIEVKGKMEKQNTRSVDQVRISKNLVWKHSFLKNWKLFPGEMRKKNHKRKKKKKKNERYDVFILGLILLVLRRILKVFHLFFQRFQHWKGQISLNIERLLKRFKQQH